jgi:hypothetical protein
MLALAVLLNNMSKTRNTDNPEDNQKKETQWAEVATTFGIAQAQIMVGRLLSEGIPARAWQESVGQTTGLTVGSLGMGHVLVPEAYVDQALGILADTDESFVDEDEDNRLDD